MTNRIIIILFVSAFAFALNSNAQNAVNQTDKQGQKTGAWIHFAKDGKTKEEEGSYLNNKKTGVWKGYFADGKLKHEITYVDGVARGHAKMYYADGTLREEGNWNESCWVGDYNYYFSNGQRAYEWHYNNSGKREGEQKYYYENGNIKYRGQWANGQVKTGVEVYDSSGKLVQNRVYKNGGYAETLEGDDLPKKQPSYKSYSEFQGTGYHTVYRLDLQVDEKGYYEDGKLINGEKYIYDEDGKARQVRIYENGKVVKVNSVTQN
ncbi:MAG: hypothetical protein LBV41_04890 [Cytophagaceae bacterium]|jgi:antitoxin component YwqK of YwqJK toxin-antitoxin module|nr:hypothetical protein [Cytophagaceae bacterium]